MKEKKKYTFIDLFAGAGGLSEGFIRAGFEPIAHIEMKDSEIIYTLKQGGVKRCKSAFYNNIINFRLQKNLFCGRIFLFDNNQKCVYES